MAAPPPPPQSKFNHYGNWISQNLEGKLFPHQIEALEDIVRWFRGPNAASTAVVVMPTGTGKTGIEVILPFFLSAKGIPMNKILILCPNSLVEQHADSFAGQKGTNRAFLVKSGLLQQDQVGQIIPPTGIVTATSTLTNGIVQYEQIISNAEKFHLKPNSVWSGPQGIPPDSFDLIIVDEAHHLPCETWQRIIQYFSNPNTKLVFFTATPFRKDGSQMDANLHLTGYAHRLLRQTAIDRNLIRAVRPTFLTGSIADPNAADDTLTDDAMFLKVLQEINRLLTEKEPLPEGKIHLAMVMANQKATADHIANLARQSYPNLGAFSYHTDNARANGSRFKLFTGENPPPQGTARPKLIVIVNKLLEGFDCEEVSVVAVTRNVGEGVWSFTQFLGRASRVVRPSDQQQFADFITHSGFGQSQNWRDYETEHLIP